MYQKENSSWVKHADFIDHADRSTSCVLGPASGAGKTKSQGKADKRQRAGRIHQGLCRNSKTDRRKYEEVRTLESNCDISDHL